MLSRRINTRASHIFCLHWVDKTILIQQTMNVSNKAVSGDISRIRKLRHDSLSPSKRIKIVERYNMSSSDRQPSVPVKHLDLISTLRRIKDLEQNNKESHEKLDTLNKHIMMFKTSISNRELDNCKLEDDIVKLDQELKHSLNDLEKLREFELDSFNSLQKMHELRMKELSVLHEERLMKLKEEASDIVMDAIEKARQQSSLKKEYLESEVANLNAQIKTHVTEMNRKLITLKENHHKKLLELHSNMNEIISELEQDRKDIEKTILAKTTEVEAMKSSSNAELDTQLLLLNQELAKLDERNEVENADVLHLKAELAAYHLQLEEIKSSCKSKLQVIEGYRSSAESMQSTFSSLENGRRFLHNKLQELKGNIRVFCRVRPVFTDHDRFSFDIASDGKLNENGKEVLTVSNDNVLNNNTHSFRVNSKMSVYDFEFDKLFAEGKSNKDIFPEISQLIQSSLDGFNVCVFAYGQTGSGKTWTMSHADDGMIPLSFKKIFEDIANLESQGWKYEVEGQFIEIYNEQIFDLLSSTSESLKCEIKHDDELQRTTVSNVTVAKMDSAKQALSYLNEATKKRSTASTMANERSSRSHLVFMLKITGKHNELGKVSAGTLNLIDLAGSERLRNSQATGSRLKETQAINKSLSCLGDVIYGLARQAPQHIPYRNSKLTYLLKYSLGGQSKTLMFVNISPLRANLSETINSLRFATKVNGTKLQ